jgi:hypothetical protein
VDIWTQRVNLINFNAIHIYIFILCVPREVPSSNSEVGMMSGIIFVLRVVRLLQKYFILSERVSKRCRTL